MEQEESGVSLLDIIKVINKHWLRLLIITLSITLVGFLFITLIYNKKKTVYYTTFTVNFPGIENNKYPNGTPYDYLEFISEENLEKVQKSSNEFASIDVTEMAAKGDITIKYGMIDTGTDPKDYESLLDKHTYTVTAKKKYFKSESQARKFLKKVAEVPTDYVKETAEKMTFDQNMKNYASSNAFDTKIDYLEAQYNLILSGIEALQETYTGDYMIGETPLKEYVSLVEIYFKDNNIHDLRNQLELGGFVSVNSDMSKWRSQRAALEIQKTDNAKKINDLIAVLEKIQNGANMGTTYESFVNDINQLTKDNVDIDRQIKAISRYMGETVAPDLDSNGNPIVATYTKEQFEAKLEAFATKLTEFTNDYTKVQRTVYSEEAKTQFTNASIIQATGSMSLLISLALPLVAGFVVGAVVNLILDMGKYLEEKKNLEAPKEA